jgi:hypothetical protein
MGLNSTLRGLSPGAKLDAPESDRFTADCDAIFSEQIFDVSVAQIKTMVEPDGVADDIRRESVVLAGIHAQ